MKCYIYFIINKTTKQRYVGQTTNFTRRRSEHFSSLEQNMHPNKKLQSAYNKYGKDSFTIEKICFENITKQELDEQEIYYIQYYNSYNNGYNLTLGGTGGDTKSKLNFEQFCFAYFGNQKYKGMTNRTGKHLGVDSACIASIAREESYDAFRQKAQKLPEEEKAKIVQKFELEMDIENNPPWTKRETPTDELSYKMLCVASTYGRGIESAMLKYFDLSKGFIFHLMTGKGRNDIKSRYANTPKEEVIKIGKKYFEEWELQSYSKSKIKEEYKDLVAHYGIADLKAP